ncbi:putative sugar phosphate phosphate translocator [Hyphodiscus hymeniophilus]|uniref:Sugar phosphate phosphate translocator n=1 Tax=Hyphodiscus hymeniophilus TaxID=353542 RepID=A0A9P7AXG4_9HELO|nr:putative sugar phosphate phosphate translocator [Hyphodiscus hymeniophilus]
MLPTIEIQRLKTAGKHPAVFVISWIALSSITILFNKYILSNLEFPAILTCWHLAFATLMTQILARTTTLLDGRKTVKMTGKVYLRAIVPIGVLYSASLVCSNQTYLYLSVAFIQMLKASAPVAVLITSWLFGVASPKLQVLLNVLIIVAGVALASFGEIKFVWLGFFYQMGGIVFEAIRLIMIQILLSGDGQNMDPLVSLYYYAPVCAVMNGIVAVVTEMGTFNMDDVWRVGVFVLLANAGVAFLLNISSVFLIGKTSGLVMTLCGVLKNILLVIASVLIWGTIISSLQILGYGIATLGLIYYGVGYDGCMTYYTVTRKYASKLWEGERREGRC